MDVLVVSPCLSFISCTLPHESTVSDLIELFSPGQAVACLDFYVKKNGRLSGGEDRLQAGAVYRLEPRLCGGKGGFGSMLRALGAQIEKTTNREACRDLSGRRLRDVNHEKEMAEWLKKQTDREAEKEQRRLEKIRRKLAEPKRGFVDAEFDQQCHDLSERLEDSVLKGMQASSSNLVQAEDKLCRKRPAAKASAKSAPHTKKNCFWTGIEDIEDMDSTDEESDESEAEGFSSSPSSSSASSSSVAGPSSISQPAAVSTSTARDQEKFESRDRPCSSSSSSSSACSAPCSPPPSQGSREEKGENGETDQEEEHSEMAQEEEHAETAQEDEHAETAQEENEEHGETAQVEEHAGAVQEEKEHGKTAQEEEHAEAAQEKEEEHAESAQEKEEEHAEPAQEKEEEHAEAAQEKKEEHAEDAQEKEEEHGEMAEEKEEEHAEDAQEKEEEHGETAEEKEHAEAAQEEEHGEMTQNEKENTQSSSSRQKAEKDKPVESVDPQKVQPEDADTPLDLLSVSGAEELETVGLERLKAELMKRGMKCGGTLQERAARLFSVRGLGAGQIDQALLAKPSKGKKK